MKIINTVSSSGGSYRIQDDPSRTSPPSGYARVPEELDLTEFYAAKGFVSPSFEDDFMTGYIVNQELLDAWNAAHPNPDAAEQQAAAVRAQRDKLLADTDWTQTLDAPIDAATREAMRTYRQALRDMPQQEGFPTDVQWPELPETTKAVPDPVDTAFDALVGIGGDEHA